MTYKSIIKAWNQTADEYNQWDSLGEDEKVEFAFLVGVFTYEVVPNRDVVAPELQYVQESYDPDDGG